MAVKNTFNTSNNTRNEGLITYDAGGENVSLSPSMVRKYLVSGRPENVTDSEVAMFISLCKYQKLNPFLREAYCIKYGTQPATMVVGKDVFVKRARRSKDFDGYSAGVVVYKKDGTTEDREGSLVLPNETLIGGWAKVYVKGMKTPYYDAVSFKEYAGKKADGSYNAQWQSKPATMIRKVALAHALREAFPDDFSGLYDASEMGINENELVDTPVKVDAPEIINPNNFKVVEPVVEEVVEDVPMEVVDDNPPYQFSNEEEISNILFGGN